MESELPSALTRTMKSTDVGKESVVSVIDEQAGTERHDNAGRLVRTFFDRLSVELPPEFDDLLDKLTADIPEATGEQQLIDMIIEAGYSVLPTGEDVTTPDSRQSGVDCTDPRIYEALSLTARSNALLADTLRNPQPQVLYTLKPAAIDTDKDEATRAKELQRIIDAVLDETDPGDEQAKIQKRAWLRWFFIYLIWQESGRGKSRKQIGGGPGRGLVQIEPATVWSLLQGYINTEKAKGAIANLAAAAGVPEGVMKKAIEKFIEENKPPAKKPSDKKAPPPPNTWPSGADAKQIEAWLLSSETFAIKLMRYEFKKTKEKNTPPTDDDNLSENPQSDQFKEDHAEHWAKWWKKLFIPPSDRPVKKQELIDKAKALDALLALPLTHCNLVKVWANPGDTEASHTVDVFPYQSDTLPTGSKLTIYIAKTDSTAVPSSGGTEVSGSGESKQFKVPKGSAIFIHYDKGRSGDNQVKVQLTEES